MPPLDIALYGIAFLFVGAMLIPSLNFIGFMLCCYGLPAIITACFKQVWNKI